MCDTIAALATPAGAGGIAVIRISGPDAEAVLRACFRRSGGETEWISHRMVYGHAVNAGGEMLDEAMAVLMRAPRSYTREDVAELHCHGGEFSVRRVLEAVFAAGARPAGPGEFTRRAYENGRIDLTRAEAVMRLISAQGDAEAREALRQMDGAVAREIDGVREAIAGLTAEIAACTDFPDEVEEAPAAGHVAREAGELAARLRAACDRDRGRVLEGGFRVVLAGKPNVGKSSILNALAGEERAIVTAQEGTTRDTLEVSLLLDGIRVRVTDTAGLREARDEAEAIGVSRARRAMEQADLVLAVIDASRPDPGPDEWVPAGGAAHAVVCNKIDLPGARRPEGAICVSAKTGEGIGALREKLREEACKAVSGGGLLTQERHVDAALRAAGALDAMRESIDSGFPLDLAAVDAGRALRALGEITGDDAQESVIDAVFSRFCVGK